MVLVPSASLQPALYSCIKNCSIHNLFVQHVAMLQLSCISLIMIRISWSERRKIISILYWIQQWEATTCLACGTSYTLQEIRRIYLRHRDYESEKIVFSISYASERNYWPHSVLKAWSVSGQAWQSTYNRLIGFWFFGNCFMDDPHAHSIFQPTAPIVLIAVCGCLNSFIWLSDRLPTPHTQHFFWLTGSESPSSRRLQACTPTKKTVFSTYVHCDFSGSEKAEGGNLPFAFEVIICSV